MAANAADPGLFAVSIDALGPPEPYGLMQRLDDEPSKSAVNAALREIFTSGEIGPIYDRWFTKPIPPRWINLNLPMSETLEPVLVRPTVVAD